MNRITGALSQLKPIPMILLGLAVAACVWQGVEFTGNGAQVALHQAKLRDLQQKLDTQTQRNQAVKTIGAASQTDRANLVRQFSDRVEHICRQNGITISQFNVSQTEKPVAGATPAANRNAGQSPWGLTEITIGLAGDVRQTWAAIQQMREIDSPIQVQEVAFAQGAKAQGEGAKPAMTTTLRLNLLVRKGA